MSKRGAEQVVDTLVGKGVRYLFSLSGNQIMSIYDATIDREIEIFHTRHEAAAVHMADAWGRLTGQPGVALLTAGPGHCNGISALYVALMAESPLVLLSGSCPKSQIGMGAFQEMDQVAIARPVTKAAWMVEEPEAVGEAISNQQPIHPLRICHALQPFLDDGGVLVSDGGEVGQWIQAGLEANYRLINGPSGSIGSALPMGLGAKVVHPDRNVFSCMGDGTFGFHAMEFDTAVRYDLPIVVLVGNDAKWNAEYQIQVKTYGVDRTVGCELLPTRY
ncbi:MAG: thiamine pyrophosphate-binding protein, partial [bacterium]|nr:thiamine pyrophosphate-binding protein [bacterium]